MLRCGRALRNGLAGGLNILRLSSLGGRLGLVIATQAIPLGVGLATDGILWPALSAAVLSMLVAWAGLRHAIVAPLREATNAVYALAGGDLSHLPQTQSVDEFGRFYTRCANVPSTCK